ncbi:hypothetical protein Rs2_11425 [Raphanus sativus]|nr:hypothetical protein Rs2_50718 [Raphanus sativus]KAJ4907767.1 hypothetical protein Rs2_11425 [Raphanus sativus]
MNIVKVSDDLAVEKDTPASSLFKRGESSLVFKPVFCSSFIEGVVCSSASMALTLAFRVFTDYSLVMGLKKADFKSALLQISTYEDWISFVEEVVAAYVLSTASDNGSSFLIVFSDSFDFAFLFNLNNWYTCCIVPLFLSS